MQKSKSGTNLNPKEEKQEEVLSIKVLSLNYPESISFGAIVRGPIIRGTIIRGGQLSEGQLSGGANFPRRQLSSGAIDRGQLSGGQFSSGAIVRTPVKPYTEGFP